MKIIRRIVICALGIAIIAYPGRANDTFVHESGGNLIFIRNTDVTIAREQLVIGPPKSAPNEPTSTVPFHVEYELRNTSSKTVNGHIGFPLPACSLTDYIEAKYATFVTDGGGTCAKEPKMTLAVDGRMTTGKWDFVFLLDGALLSDDAPGTALARRIRVLIETIHDPTQEHDRDGAAFLSAARTLCIQLGGHNSTRRHARNSRELRFIGHSFGITYFSRQP